MPNRPRIWLTRPLADSEHFAGQLAAHHIQSIIAPVMHIEHVPLAVEDFGPKPTALLLTSRHAAQALGVMPPAWRNLPAYCVGHATAQAAHAMGFTHTIEGESDVLALLPRIAQETNISSRILYLAGEETRADIPTLLGAQGIHVTNLIAYRASAASALSNDLIDALRHGRVQGIMLFSPRSATLAVQLLAHHHLSDTMKTVEAYCLSLNVAATAAALGCKRLHTCHSPTADAMRDLIVSLAPQTMV
ncbi:MAG: uroporphyrinogen-III synthase [Pseudomonadota bacterium]